MSDSIVVHMPDIEYIRWKNINKKRLEEILNSNSVETKWLNADNNKEFLIRYFEEMGYTIQF